MGRQGDSPRNPGGLSTGYWVPAAPPDGQTFVPFPRVFAVRIPGCLYFPGAEQVLGGFGPFLRLGGREFLTGRLVRFLAPESGVAY